MKLRRLLLPAALLACSGAAFAQQNPQAAQPAAQPAQAQPVQQQLTPEQQAQLARQDAQMTQAAQEIMQMVDTNRTAAVWDGGSAAMKGLVNSDEFVKQVTVDRNRLGPVAARGKAVVTRSQFPAGADVPEGLYLNVAVPTKFANEAQPVRELVSFRLDEDKTWRVSGYSVRSTPQ